MAGSSVRPPATEVIVGRSLRDPDSWLKVIAWVVIIGSALSIATFSFGRDQGIYAVVGDGILRGEMPYRDLWDFKPPGIFLVHALSQALFGKHMFAVRLLEVLSLLGCVGCLRAISQIFFENRTPGLVGARPRGADPRPDGFLAQRAARDFRRLLHAARAVAFGARARETQLAGRAGRRCRVRRCGLAQAAARRRSHRGRGLPGSARAHAARLDPARARHRRARGAGRRAPVARDLALVRGPRRVR